MTRQSQLGNLFPIQLTQDSFALRLLLPIAFFAVVGLLLVNTAGAHDENDPKNIGSSAPANNNGGGGGGSGGNWQRNKVQLLSHMWLDEIGNLGASNVIGNDIWGWTDQSSGREFALFGLTNGTSFIEVTDPTSPVYLGTLQTQTGNRSWRDMKIYKDQAYIVSDNNGAHGVQVFDMKQLLTASQSDPNNPTYYNTVGVYSGITRGHNIFINEDTGYAYVAGSNQASGGLHVLNLNGANGAMPTFAGNFSADGYTHDTQVVTYTGPDSNFTGREIAFNSNEDTLTIVDVTDKSNMVQLARQGYAGAQYAHQGWLSDDQRYFFMNDELDERRSSDPIQTATRVWDVSDLANPFLVGIYEGTEQTIDHNLYVKGDLIFQANYTSGLRILKVNDAATMDIEEYGFFDTYDADNNVTFNGAWSVYPYFESGNILVSDRQNGLFVLKMVPEPSSMLVLSMIGLGIALRRRR
ncbi:MAG: choice-of-anchor B family protein [Planctomycetota bacterium]